MYKNKFFSITNSFSHNLSYHPSSGLVKEHEGLQKKCRNKLSSLQDLLTGRRKFEADVEACQAWMNEAEVALSAELRTSNLQLIQEQLNKVCQLSE